MTTAVLIHEPDSAEELAYYGATLRKRFPDIRLGLAGNHAEAVRLAPEFDVIVAKSMHVSREMVAAMPRLAWIQSLISGVDHLSTIDLPGYVRVSAARGIHGPQMTELAILHMLALNRHFPEMLRHQADKAWVVWTQPLLANKTVVIVGVGAIATAIAQRCRAFGMKVVGVTRRNSAPGFDELYPRSRLAEAAAEADFLLVLRPLDEGSLGLIGQNVFAAMRPESFLINIARGGVVDETALIEALRNKAIAGAAIDVASVEPLPSSSELWNAPNLIITPHVGGRSNVYHYQVTPLLEANLELYLNGRADDIPHQIKL